MAFTFSQTVIVGNIVADPHPPKYTASGMAIFSFRAATEIRRKNKDTGEWEGIPEYHSIVAFGRVAEAAIELSLVKGQPVTVVGRNQTRKWEKEGVERWTTEIVAETIQAGMRRPGSSTKPSATSELSDEEALAGPPF